jgi:hypothetical protein
MQKNHHTSPSSNSFILGHRLRSAVAIVACALFLVVASVSPLVTRAASNASLYTYDFSSVSGAQVPNTAAANTTAVMNLTGAWSQVPDGVRFQGNTVDTQSGGNAKPTSGTTLNVPATQSVGAAVVFTYQASCITDSQNMSQVGPFANAVTQVKLQLSKCKNGVTYPECRLAGALTPSTALALRGDVGLQDGVTYRLSCYKTPDTGTTATVTMNLTSLDANNQDTTTATKTFPIPATGAMVSSERVTAGNKYPLPLQTSNTDQFNGILKKIAYCASAVTSEVAACLSDETAFAATPPQPPAGTADEIKYAFGSTPDSVVFSWRGTEQTLYYGLDTSYGSSVTAANSAITPVDTSGPFREAVITGLQPGTTYHYKVGSTGADATFTTTPAETTSFKVLSTGDTIASSCRSYQTQQNQLLFAENADFMIHGGDIAIANECGVPAIHQYFTDMQPLFQRAAFMPVWGNHEYGQPTATAPAGTPRDTLANYKGRVALPNAQTVPGDIPSKTSQPGCGEEIGSSTNTCLGEDWGWFKAGRVLFVSFPELSWNSIQDWQTKAAALMQQAQDDASVDYIVTYGHRPVLSSTGWTPSAGYEAAFTALADQFSPTARVGGKYVLNITQHRHSMEVFPDYHGVMHVVNGGGGQGLINFQTILPGSEFRMKHLGYSTLAYDAQARQLTYNMVCGVTMGASAETPCTAGATVYSKTFSRP